MPNASEMQVSSYDNEVMRSWYNVTGVSNNLVRNVDDISNSTQRILTLLTNEVTDFYNGDYGKVIVAGFSQGASMSLNIGVHCQHTLGGIIVNSGFAIPTVFEHVLQKCDDNEMKNKK